MGLQASAGSLRGGTAVTGEPTHARAGRWALLVGLVVVCLIAGLALAFGGYIGGRGLATASGDRGQSLAMWVGAGLALGGPVAALHRLGFPVSTRVSLTCAAIVATVVAAGGFLLSADDWPGTSITVEAGNGTCTVSSHTADGPVVFWVTNVGDGVMSVSLHDSGGQVVAEVDDIGPAMTQAMAANVYDGEYELLCRPAQGEGIRTNLTVG